MNTEMVYGDLLIWWSLDGNGNCRQRYFLKIGSRRLNLFGYHDFMAGLDGYSVTGRVNGQ